MADVLECCQFACYEDAGCTCEGCNDRGGHVIPNIFLDNLATWWFRKQSLYFADLLGQNEPGYWERQLAADIEAARIPNRVRRIPLWFRRRWWATKAFAGRIPMAVEVLRDRHYCDY